MRRHVPGSDPGTYAEAVEARLVEERIGQLRNGLTDLHEAIEQEISRE